jgi:hypothetical protein
VYYGRRNHHGDRRGSPTEYELSRADHLWLNLADIANKHEKALANEPMNDKRIMTIYD